MDDNMRDERAPEENAPEKENKIKGFFKMVGKKIDDAAYDARLTAHFEKSHAQYQVFTGTSLLAPNPEIYAEEHLEDEQPHIVMLGGDDCIKPGCLIRRANDRAVRRIAAVESAALDIEFEGKSNRRPATKITLGDEAEKVDVIKVGDEFYRI